MASNSSVAAAAGERRAIRGLRPGPAHPAIPHPTLLRPAPAERVQNLGMALLSPSQTGRCSGRLRPRARLARGLAIIQFDFKSLVSVGTVGTASAALLNEALDGATGLAMALGVITTSRSLTYRAFNGSYW